MIDAKIGFNRAGSQRGDNWRVAAGVKTKVTVPEWLTNAKNMGSVKFVPTAEQLVLLGKSMKSFNINLTLKGEELNKEGLFVKLEGVTNAARSDIYKAIVKVAENGFQSQPVTVALEDVLEVRNLPDIQLGVLVDAKKSLKAASEIEEGGAKLILEKGPKPTVAMGLLFVADVYKFILEERAVNKKLQETTLFETLNLWRELSWASAGWPKETYTLPNIIQEVLG